MTDLTLTCPECTSEFTFTETEQAYCTEHAFPPPSRCPECQSRRKSEKDAERDSKRSRGRGHKRKR